MSDSAPVHTNEGPNTITSATRPAHSVAISSRISLFELIIEVDSLSPGITYPPVNEAVLILISSGATFFSTALTNACPAS